MRALTQRVGRAAVWIGGREFSRVGAGLLVLVGVEEADGREDVRWIAEKIIKLRIFDDPQRVMNLDVRQTGGQVMIVSQFTLHASMRRGNRPSWIRAARGEKAVEMYGMLVDELRAALGGAGVETGEFGADMQVESLNDGPVTIWLDSKNRE